MRVGREFSEDAKGASGGGEAGEGGAGVSGGVAEADVEGELDGIGRGGCYR